MGSRENWFQYVRRVYATAINFPCIKTLVRSIEHSVRIGLQRFPLIGYVLKKDEILMTT